MMCEWNEEELHKKKAFFVSLSTLCLLIPFVCPLFVHRFVVLFVLECPKMEGEVMKGSGQPLLLLLMHLLQENGFSIGDRAED